MDSDYKVDILKMYFDLDMNITEDIKIHQPTIQEIIDYGETEFWNTAYLLTANPTSMRLALWDSGVDWNKINDFDLFINLVKDLPVELTSIFFGDLDFSKFFIIKKDEVEEDKSPYVMVYSPNSKIQIDENLYIEIVQHLRVMLDIHPKKQKAKNKITKELIIEEERDKNRIATLNAKKSPIKKSLLFSFISSALNHPGFKYKKNELRDVGILEFMDSIKRIHVYEEVTSLMTGMYMGMVDLKGRDLNKDLNWSRDLYESIENKK